MKLYLVRHGDSLSHFSDNERPLSETGREDITLLANFIEHLNLNVSCLYQSQKLRAQQTAKILSIKMPCLTKIQTRSELDPMASVVEMATEIQLINQDLMLVGHMPFMSYLVSTLVLQNSNLEMVSFHTGTMVCLEKRFQNEWTINWVITPEILKQ